MTEAMLLRPSTNLRCYKPYPEYRYSGVEWLGSIPAHWECKKIKRLCLVRRGASPRPIDDPIYFDDDGEYSWVRIADVTASTKYLLETTQKLSDLGKSKSVPLEPGELFLSIAATVGKPIITKIRCCIHDGFVYFVGLNYNKEFLYYLFSCGEPYKGLGKLGTQLNLNTDTIGDIYVPLPKAEEQMVIVQYLDRKTGKIDALIANKEQLITLLWEKRSALITRAITKGLDPNVPMKDSDVEWIGEIPAKWRLVRLKYLTSEPLTYGANEVGDIADPELPRYIRITDVCEDGTLRNDTFVSLAEDIAEPYLLKQGDLLLARSGATVGKSFLYDKTWGRAAYAGYLIRARLDDNKTVPKFIWYFAQSESYWDWLNSNFIQATIQNVSAERYSNLSIPLPSLDEQNRIVSFLDEEMARVELLINKIREATERLKEYRTALISAAVTGKIDVREEAV